ncbi:transcription factor, contains a PHD finger motif [Dipsacomyces acuminosporus]|nr:transcription factor, contains a PHD finger motif [Dipsacomyces acuminosporus]
MTSNELPNLEGNRASSAATESGISRQQSTVPVDNFSEYGEDVVTKEKLLPKVKQVSKCCYCDKNSAESLKTVPCLECGSRCHIDCINCTANFKDKILLGDDFFHFKCAKCTDGHERFKRYHLSWVDVVHITLFNLTHNPPMRPNNPSSRTNPDDPAGQFSSSEHGPQEYGDGRIYFHYKADVARFIDQHWSYFWTKSRGETWINSASSALSTNSTENVPEDGRFESGKAKYNKNGMWALTDDLRFPSSYDSLQQQKTRTIMYSFADDGSLIELRTQSGNGRRKRRTEPTAKTTTPRTKKPRAGAAPGSNSAASAGEFVSASGVVASSSSASKRGSRSKREQRSSWSISMWPDIDNPQGPAHMSREETHAAAQFVIESDRMTVWNDKGYRMAKASHGVESGAWYFEVEVLQPVRPEHNLRIGWSQISGELQAPCGFDVFSYSVRAKPSTRFHAAIGSPYGEEYGPGDTLGVLIYLPELDADEKQDLADRKWRPGERYRPFTYSRPESQRPPNDDHELPPLPVLANSELVYFKNGRCLGPAFQKLYLGKYYPAISSYMGGKVKVNLGPDFKFSPPSVWHNNAPIRPISDLEYTLPPPEPQPAEKAPEAVKPEQPEVAAAAAAATLAGATVTTAATPATAEAPAQPKTEQPVPAAVPAPELPGTAKVEQAKEPAPAPSEVPVPKPAVENSQKQSPDSQVEAPVQPSASTQNTDSQTGEPATKGAEFSAMDIDEVDGSEDVPEQQNDTAPASEQTSAAAPEPAPAKPEPDASTPTSQEQAPATEPATAI